MKTSKLIVEYDYEFELIAVISAVKPHKLAWELNNALQVQLAKKDDLLFDFLKDRSKLYFTQYGFETEFFYIRLFKNKAVEFDSSLKPFLIPELKEYDYLIQFGGDAPIGSVQEIVDKIKTMPSVEFVKVIDVQNLKSKENLIF